MTAWLASAARRDPGALALVQGTERIDYAGLAERAATRAAMLAGAGLRAGDRVMLETPATLESAIWLHALLWLGAAVVPFSPSLPRRELESLLVRLKARALITSRPTPDRPRSACAHGDFIVMDGARPVDACIAPLAPAEHNTDRLATIVLTSGSSTTPKAVPLTLANHAESWAAIARRVGTAPGDRWLLCLPLEHVGGLAILFRSVISGASVALLQRFDAAQFLQQTTDQRITLTSMVPAMLDAVLKLGDHSPAASLRGAFIGGAPASPDLLARARDAGWPVLPTWGMTEAGSQLATPSPAMAGRMDFRSAIGPALPPLPGVEVRTAATGALQVRGPMLFSAYLDDAASGPDQEGWFTTGDRGIVDSRGYVQVHGRIDNVIISGGVNVHLDAVARRLGECPLIEDVAVVGVEDTRWGQRVAAAVVVAEAEGGLPDGIDAWSRHHLAPAERPAHWRAVDCIPRSSAGKPLSPAIRALFE